jgi:TRAP-type C4-dicarboxylate transport system permease small subunit
MYDIVNEALKPLVGDITVQSGTQILQRYLQNFVTLGIGLAGIVAFFVLLLGGYNYIMAAGDKDGTQKAQKTISGALIGLAIVFSIFAIIFTMELLFGVSITTFTIPTIN